MLDIKNSGFLENSHIEANNQYGLDYMQRLESLHNDDSSNNGSNNLGHSGISPKPIRSESPNLQFVDVQQHYMNPKNKPGFDKISVEKLVHMDS